EAAEAARLVIDDDADAPDMPAFAIGPAVPGHVEPPLGAVREVLESLAVDGMDCNAFSGRHDADDAVSRQGMTAAGVMDGHAWYKSTDRDAVFLASPCPFPRQGHDLAALARRGPRARKDGVEDFPPRQNSFTDGGEEIL